MKQITIEKPTVDLTINTDLARKIHENMANWTRNIPSWHNVNIAQCFRAPAVYFQQARDPYFLQATERNYAMVWGTYGQFPGGMFGGDENCRRGYYDPRQGIETCASVEFMLSCEMLLKITGELTWADRCEPAFRAVIARTPGVESLTPWPVCNLASIQSQARSLRRAQRSEAVRFLWACGVARFQEPPPASPSAINRRGAGQRRTVAAP